ncbi:hypothetical protein ZEAMMB73_Zm00001d046532 [Zea mays]|uniref:Aminoacyl-tRNA synthetase class Ia domain-containing protein n=1 Tax=Zea mays TaxID=4577 RepID=A0A1D6P365_MAIZE|nr:hypothetical protein ZEAMMB73_Zm00001d046532 [Zea mays]
MAGVIICRSFLLSNFLNTARHRITNRQQVFDLGKYNETCHNIVTKYISEWEAMVTRTRRWIDFKNDYKTMDLNFMESVWWVFAKLWEKDLIYKGVKGHLHTNRVCDNVRTFILTDATFKSTEIEETLSKKRSRLPAPGDADELSVIEDQIAWIVHIIASIVKKSPQRGREATLDVSLKLIKASTSRGLGHLPVIGVVVEPVMVHCTYSSTYNIHGLVTDLSPNFLLHPSCNSTLAEKELLEEEYKKKFDEAKKELSLENDLAGMWILVAKLKIGALDISDLNVDDRTKV